MPCDYLAPYCWITREAKQLEQAHTVIMWGKWTLTQDF